MTEGIIEKLDGTTVSLSEKMNKTREYYMEQYSQDLTDVCDLSIGSEIRTLLDSFHVECFDIEFGNYEQFKQTFVKYARKAHLDLKACEYKLNRKQGTVAGGEVTFTLPGIQETNYLIPAGTIILHRDTGNEYMLTSDVEISAGTQTANGYVVSTLVGSQYNTGPDKLTAFKNIFEVDNSLKVNNNGDINGGTDKESDDSLRERIFKAKAERASGTTTYYSNLLLDSIPELHDISLVNPNAVTNHYIIKEDGTKERCTKCKRVIYCNAYEKPCPITVLESAEAIVSQQDNLVIGHDFHVQAASLATFYLDVGLYLKPGASVSEEEVVDAMLAYINGGTVGTEETGQLTFPGLKIGQSVEKHKLFDAIEMLDNVQQVESITRIKHDSTLKLDDNWVKIDNNKFSLLKDGYTFSREGDNIDYWGKRNFNTINIVNYAVAQLGYKKNVDSSTNRLIGYTPVATTT